MNLNMFVNIVYKELYNYISFMQGKILVSSKLFDFSVGITQSLISRFLGNLAIWFLIDLVWIFVFEPFVFMSLYLIVNLILLGT